MSDTPQLHLDEPPPIRFYMVIGGQRQGPFALEDLPEHGLEYDTLVWHTGMSGWMRADKVPALREVLLTIPPPLPEPLLPGPRPARDTPDALRGLYLWWLLLTGAVVVLPLLGGASLGIAQAEYGPRHSPMGFVYYDYSSLGRGFLVLGTLLIGAGALALIPAVVVFSVLLYKVWALIQDGHARTTPERAVGFLFIPFFNLYWVFVAVHGLAVDLEQYLRRHGRLDVPPPPAGLAMAFCVLFVCSAVPYLNVVAVIPMLVVLVLLLMSFKHAAVALVAGRRPAEPPRAFGDSPDAITERRPAPEAL